MRAERVFAHLFADVHAFQSIDFRELRIVTAADDCVVICPNALWLLP